MNVLWYSVYAKNYKKWLNGSKDSNLKIKRFVKYCPNSSGEGDREKIVHINPKKSTFQDLFKYEIRFSKSLAVVLDIGI